MQEDASDSLLEGKITLYLIYGAYVCFVVTNYLSHYWLLAFIDSTFQAVSNCLDDVAARSEDNNSVNASTFQGTVCCIRNKNSINLLADPFPMWYFKLLINTLKPEDNNCCILMDEPCFFQHQKLIRLTVIRILPSQN